MCFYFSVDVLRALSKIELNLKINREIFRGKTLKGILARTLTKIILKELFLSAVGTNSRNSLEIVLIYHTLLIM